MSIVELNRLAFANVFVSMCSVIVDVLIGALRCLAGLNILIIYVQEFRLLGLLVPIPSSLWFDHSLWDPSDLRKRIPRT